MTFALDKKSLFHEHFLIENIIHRAVTWTVFVGFPYYVLGSFLINPWVSYTYPLILFFTLVTFILLLKIMLADRQRILPSAHHRAPIETTGLTGFMLNLCRVCEYVAGFALMCYLWPVSQLSWFNMMAVFSCMLANSGLMLSLIFGFCMGWSNLQMALVLTGTLLFLSVERRCCIKQ